MLAVVAAVAALALPASGVAVQHGEVVTLLRLDGRAVQTLPGWRIEPAFGTRVGVVYLRAPDRSVWRLAGGALERAGRVPRPHFSGGCFSTAPGTHICGRPYGPGLSRILVGARVVPGSRRAHGRWLLVDRSPRGRLLAQWSGECEIPSAYEGDASRIRAVVDPAIESFALGWAGERPVLAFPVAACGSAYDRAGVYVGTRWVHGLGRGDLAELWR